MHEEKKAEGGHMLDGLRLKGLTMVCTAHCVAHVAADQGTAPQKDQ
jgi:hypothetical protein